MKNFFTFLSLFLFFSLMAVGASAQTTVSGTITDAETKEPLIGATILAKGTDKGTITDFDGKYSLEVPEGANEIVVSYTGYATQTLPVSGGMLDIAMSKGTLLDEVVIIGYGSVKKGDLTGSVASLKEDDFNQGAIASPDQLLAGRASGVQITSSSGAPGASSKIFIRGTSSVRAGNSPLIVVDGVQLDNRSAEPGGDIKQLGRSQGSNPLNFIDPNSIASIQVLKDASAAAIYGSRGANGVIIITTKKGQNGEAKINYTVQQGIASIAKKPDYLSADEYRDALKSEVNDLTNDGGANVDALDAILQTGRTNQHNISISGGTDKASYRFTGGYFDQSGIVINTGLNKINAGFNGSFKMLPNNRLTLDMGITTSKVQKSTAPISDDAGYEGSIIGAALQWNPTTELESNNEYDQSILEKRNPLAMAEYIKDRSDINRTIANIGATLKLIDNLNYKFTFGYDNARGERRASADPALNFEGIKDRGQAIVGNNQLSSTQLSHTLNYDANLTSSINLNALVGYEYLKYTNRGATLFAEELAADTDLDLTDILQSAPNSQQNVTSFHDPDVELQSYFARAMFNISEKYLVTATVRQDGSSKFGENNQTGVFPSFAVAWNIGNESFAPDFFDNLKFRAGWGLTGNQEFPAGSAQNYFKYDNGNLVRNNAANPDLKWEASEQLNFGLDFAFMDYKVSGSIDFFNKTMEDLILFVPLPQPNPSTESSIYRNVDGNVVNKGVELSLNTFLVNKENFTFDLGVNMTFLSNKVDGFTSYLNTGAINGQGLTGAYAQRIVNGESLFSYFLPVWTGLNGEGLSEYEDPVTGGTTLIATVNSVKQYIGDPLPDFMFGFNTNFKIYDIDVMMNWSGMTGYQIYNNTANAVFVKGNIANGRNVSSDLIGNGESVNNSYPASTRYLEDGDHLRLANMTIAYSFKKVPNFLNGLKVSLTGTNLLMFTKYSGFDPVVDTNKEIGGIPSFGIEYTPYPTSRAFMLGLSVDL